jgi:TPR repeat protein
MYALGALHSDLTQPPNLEAARHWFQQAANAGHSGAMYLLGYLYAQLMTPPDLHAARGWYERAAAGNMHNLDVLYEESTATRAGWGVRPPSGEEMDAMVDWLDGPGIGVEEGLSRRVLRWMKSPMLSNAGMRRASARHASRSPVCSPMSSQLQCRRQTPTSLGHCGH